jgi:formylglycine-generating enzyme required for sulfatase activity
MVVVPAGSFMMGSPASEEGRDADEGPQHRVTIARSFAVGKFEVTFAEWDACVAAGGCSHNPGDSGWGRGKRPVINVSWDDITRQYLPWLSGKTGKAYRLLTEAEWEHAARAGTTTPFWWGSSISASQANYHGPTTYGGGPKGEYRQKTVPVDSFAANPWGLYNVHGNVWEWVQDCWNGSYSGAPSDGSAWTTGDCSRRVLRGGSCVNYPQLLRSAYRGRFTPDNRGSYVGFRVGRTL